MLQKNCYKEKDLIHVMLLNLYKEEQSAGTE